jgi:hypothetical protein
MDERFWRNGIIQANKKAIAGQFALTKRVSIVR